jgi:hypothetical protein
MAGLDTFGKNRLRTCDAPQMRGNVMRSIQVNTKFGPLESRETPHTYIQGEQEGRAGSLWSHVRSGFERQKPSLLHSTSSGGEVVHCCQDRNGLLRVTPLKPDFTDAIEPPRHSITPLRFRIISEVRWLHRCFCPNWMWLRVHRPTVGACSASFKFTPVGKRVFVNPLPCFSPASRKHRIVDDFRN